MISSSLNHIRGTLGLLSFCLSIATPSFADSDAPPQSSAGVTVTAAHASSTSDGASEDPDDAVLPSGAGSDLILADQPRVVQIAPNVGRFDFGLIRSLDQPTLVNGHLKVSQFRP